MKWLLGPVLTLASTLALANLHLAPPDFETNYGRAIFVDFIQANYEITYDVSKKTAKVKSLIHFKAKKKGRPLFDLVPTASLVKINGQDTTQRLISLPGAVSKARMVDLEIGPGMHVLEMENALSTNLTFNPGNLVFSAFWIRDLKDRMFLEQYFPSNLEFDQYKIIMDIKFKGVSAPKQDFYTNGKITQIAPAHWRIEYPDYFTVSCPYFHMTPRGWKNRRDFSYTSINGREIPITVYSPWSSRTKKLKEEVPKILKELEADYGPWPHPALLAYGTFPGTGGMEHAGATATSIAALDHELLHSYFAKGIMPANGNSGWIDEAIASWRDRGYPRKTDPGFDGSDLGGHSVYRRNTDDRAYGQGASFMSYLDWRLKDTGGLKAFLKGYFHAYKHKVVTTEHFKNNLEFFTGMDFEHEFATYIWGKKSQIVEKAPRHNPHHRELTDKELNSLL